MASSKEPIETNELTFSCRIAIKSLVAMATTRYTTRIRTCTNWRPTMPSAPLLWVFPLFFFFFCNIKYNKHDFKLRLTITNQNSILENDHPSTSWIPQPIATLFSSGPLTLFFFFFLSRERAVFTQTTEGLSILATNCVAAVAMWTASECTKLYSDLSEGEDRN